MEEKKKFKITPSILIILTFITTILVGTILLVLPISTVDRKGVNFIDSLFIATSATCVTGLSPIACGEVLSIFGQAVLAILIEIGGLSFLTIVSFIFIIIGKKMDISSRVLLKEQLNQDSIKGVSHLIKRIVFASLSIQLIGAIASFFVFKFGHNIPVGQSIRLSLFHAISAFNNAGFDLFTGIEPSMIGFRNDIALNIITMILILLGGIGFVVMSEIVTKKKWRFFSLNTKVVLIMTLILFVGGTILFKLFMWNEMTFLQAMFSSVTELLDLHQSI